MKPLERLKVDAPHRIEGGYGDMYVVVGIDPGIVNTGIIIYFICPQERLVILKHTAIKGCKTEDIFSFLSMHLDVSDANPWTYVFVEAYRPRSHFDTDARMGAAVNEIKKMGPEIYALDNSGVKNVVSRALLELLHSWSFTTKSNHQDVRSAARIAILGMLKNEHLNQLLADLVMTRNTPSAYTYYAN